jgi:hydrogenase expression/formation protein HypE
MGKLPNKELKKLLACIKRDPKIIVSATPGYDSGVHLMDNDSCMVVSTDPCINIDPRWFGWLLIHYAASDVALFGVKPQFCTINLLSPSFAKHENLISIMKDACRAADEIGVGIVTGHTGTYKGLTTTVGVCTAYGTIARERLITPGNAKTGDSILCVKPIGLETVVNFCLANTTAAHRLFGPRRKKEIEKLVPLESCVREALLLADTAGVHAMHDATEGGLTAALIEMAEASELSFEVNFEKLRFADDMRKIRTFFGLSDQQMMSTSSTGTFLAAVDPSVEKRAMTVLHGAGIDASVIGTFTKGERRVLVKDGKKALFPKKTTDPYERILSGKV